MNTDILSKRITHKSPMHIVLLADDSSSMAGDAAAAATEAIRAWVSELYVATKGKKPYFRFSLVSVGSAANIVGEALNVLDVDVTQFLLDGSSGTTNFPAVLTAAKEILLRDGATAEHCPPFVFLFTDGRPTNGDGEHTPEAEQIARDAAGALRSLPLPCGAPLLVTLGFGTASDTFLREIASAPNMYLKLPNARALIPLLPAIGTPTTTEGGVPTVASMIHGVAKVQDRG